MSTRSILGLIYMVQGLQQLGHDPEPILQRHGLSLAQLDPTTRIERSRELRIYADLSGSMQDPLIGLKLGGFYGLAGYGPLVMLLMTCATAYEALQVGVKYQRLTYLYGTLRLEPGEHMSALILDPMTMGHKAFRFRVDGEVAGTFKLVKDMQATMGLNLKPERVDMPYPKPPEAAAYEAHFRCPVKFGFDQGRIWIPNAPLATRMPTGDAVAHRMYRAQCDALLQSRRQGVEGMVERVREHLGLFSDNFPAAGEVAAALGMSERTLRRQLDAEATSFRTLLDEVRAEKARLLLRAGNSSVEAVARQLGYAEPASFIRAFQRWTGTTPAAFRRAAAQGR